MKKIILLLVLILNFSSCSTDNDDTIPTQQVSLDRELIFLKVDYQTNTFLGGNIFSYSNLAMSSTIPLAEDYVYPADFGSYSLTFTPTNEVIFDEPINWLGGAQNDIAVNYSVNDFTTSTSNASVDFNDCQYFMPTESEVLNEGYPINYQNVWNAVSSLEITNEVINDNGKVGFFLYTPGLGVFTPEKAQWFVILYH